MNHNELRDRIHQANIDAGWWSNLETGESIIETRSRPEMLVLIISELCEAWLDGNDPDGHLPQYKAFNVEIADAAIRILDLSGGDNIDLMEGRAESVSGLMTHDVMQVIATIGSDALEGFRKSNTGMYHEAIQTAYYTLFRIAEVYDFDLIEMIEAKVAYNAQRADHKIENRKASDGKKI